MKREATGNQHRAHSSVIPTPRPHSALTLQVCARCTRTRNATYRSHRNARERRFWNRGTRLYPLAHLPAENRFLGPKRGIPQQGRPTSHPLARLSTRVWGITATFYTHLTRMCNLHTTENTTRPTLDNANALERRFWRPLCHRAQVLPLSRRGGRESLPGAKERHSTGGRPTSKCPCVGDCGRGTYAAMTLFSS